jgi:hypothetical protein
VRERLALSKQATRKIDTERYDLKKLNKWDVKEEHQVCSSGKLKGQWGHQQGMGQY